MRIATHTVSESIVRQIQQLGTQQAKYQNQVATGLRISQPEDDPAAVGRVLNLESEQRRVVQFQSNANRALNLSNASYSGLRAIKSMSDRATEIGTLGGGAISAASAQAYASELDQLIEQSLQVGNSRFGNDYLYAGTAVDAAPFVATRGADGRISAVAYRGNSERSAIPLSESSTLEVSSAGATNLGIGDFLNQLVALREALNANDTAAVAVAQETLVATEDLLVASIAEHGGVQTRIETAQAQLSDRTLSLKSLVSDETEADLPSTIVKLNQTQTAYQAALQSAANIMKVSLLDYLR